jgi:hypothetical protein
MQYIASASPSHQALLNFIRFNSHCDLVIALEYVLVDIFGSINRYAYLHINMAFIAATEITIIRGHGWVGRDGTAERGVVHGNRL